MAIVRHILPTMQNKNLQLLPSIHPGYARLLVAHARNKGVDINELFKGNSLTWRDLLESQNFVSFEQFKRLLLQAQRLTESPQIELEISSISQASSHGPLGYGALAAPSLRATFDLVRKMLATRIKVIELEVIEEAETAVFRVHETLDLCELRMFVMIMLIASFIDLITKSTGEDAPQLTISLPFKELPDLGAYQAKFPSVHFLLGSECLDLHIPLELLDQPCLTVDEFAYRNALRECEQLLLQEDKGGAFARQVKTYLLGCNGHLPTQVEAASDFSVSVRTFIRKLKLEDTNYQTLLDEVRKELVVWYLSSGTLTIEQIADLVGYADTSNFSRVFRRWFNQTPTEFRAEHI
jgi:AraC-like DNA-binding protein